MRDLRWFAGNTGIAPVPHAHAGFNGPAGPSWQCIVQAQMIALACRTA
jgi:hypothetical protein